MGLVALGFAVHTLAHDWHDVRARPVRWTPTWLALSVVAAAASQLAMAAAWADLVIAVTPVVSRTTALRLWFAGQLGRFLPTGLGSLPARVAVCRAAGITTTVAAATTAAELAVALAISGAAALLLLPAGLIIAPAEAVAVVVASALVARAATRGARTTGAAITFTLLHLAKQALRTGGVWALLEMVGSVSPSLRLLAGGVGFAYLAGLLAVFAPGGIGVRETVLAAALTRDGVPAAVALGCAFGWRFVETGSELSLVGLTHTLSWSRSLIARDPRPDSSTARG
jgi:uncharacterized membrane protein YbhN (UPF0104 family)